MCCGSTSKSNFCPFDMETDSGVGSEISPRRCSKLLELAAADDLAGFIREIEERGVDVNAIRFWYGRSSVSERMGFMERTPIMIASLHGSTHVLNYLIETCKVNVNKACGSDGATALHCAAAAGAWYSVEILISASADTNAVDASGKKPGELIAPFGKSSIGSKRRLLDLALTGEEAPEKKESLNLDEFFGSTDPSTMSLLPKVNGLSHMRASYPSKNQAPGYDFDSAAAAIMNSRASAFSKRSQSFGYSRGLMANWGSADGKVDWGFNGEDASKLRKSASFSAAAVSPRGNVPLRRGVHEVMPLWVDRMHVEQEQMVA